MGQEGLLPLGGRRHPLLFEGAAHPAGHELDQLAVHGGERRRPGPEAGEVERAVDVLADPDRCAQIGFQLEFQVAGMPAPVAGRGVFEAQRFLGAQGIAAVGVVESEDISWADFAAGRDGLDDFVAIGFDMRQDTDRQPEALAAHRQHGLDLVDGVAAWGGNDLVQLAHGLHAAP